MRCLFPFTLVAAVALAVGCREAVEEEREPVEESQVESGTHPTLADALSEASNAEKEVLDDKGGDVDAGPVKLTAPAGWGRRKASSGFVMAEWVLPRAQGDDADGRLTISSAGGGIEANLERWRTQFEGKLTKETQSQVQVDGMDVTTVDFSGDYNESRGMMGPSVLRKNYRMLAAIIPAGDQSVFIKAYGPQATMESHAGKFQEFAKSAKKK